MSTDTLYDPLRRKEVAATPEERVRQWFIVCLREDFGVPVHLMMSEVGMKFGKKPYRADILVYDRSGSPLAVVECKRPDVELTGETARQALRYDMVLSVRWIILTNGHKTFVFQRSGDTFEPCAQIPDYETMTCQR
ncbi:MAG: type I restriction enzyme HsdR N-terminal domain-containing protein [Bacteroidales bacterium]|nr:type I restriction enzyme HsdR N-terminal domain-containing protein [Bacteroidales bacterium]